jgi:hypothetical protein
VKALLAQPSVQISLCLAVYALVGLQFGAFGLVLSSPLLAACIARPLLNLIGSMRQTLRERVWLPVHGDYFVFKGVRIEVVEDEDHCRWVRLADARKAAGLGATDAALAIRFGPRLVKMGRTAQLYLRDDALVELLSKSTDAHTLRFRHWVEADIVKPGAKIRSSKGIRLDD